MKTLRDLWLESGHDKKQKFRFADWNHRTKFFCIEGLTEDGRAFLGRLDNGETLTIPVESDFWIEYFPGDEERARAV